MLGKPLLLNWAIQENKVKEEPGDPLDHQRTSNNQIVGRAHIHSSKKDQRKVGPAWKMHVFGVTPHSAESLSHRWFDWCLGSPCFEHKLRSQSLNSPLCHFYLCLRHGGCGRLVPGSSPYSLSSRKRPVLCQHPGGEGHQNVLLAKMEWKTT